MKKPKSFSILIFVALLIESTLSQEGLDLNRSTNITYKTHLEQNNIINEDSYLMHNLSDHRILKRQGVARQVPALTRAPQTRPRTCSQSCNQLVTGRGLKYNRALQIIQNEEYLDKTDTSIIRRNFIESQSEDFLYQQHRNEFSNEDYEDAYTHILSRRKRAIANVIKSFISYSSVQTYCSKIKSYGESNFQSSINVIIEATCTDTSITCCGAVDYPSISLAISTCNLDPNCCSTISLSSLTGTVPCISYLQSFIATVIPIYCTKDTTPPNIGLIPPAVIGTSLAGGLIAIGTFAAIPMAPPLVTNNGVPPNNPQPGTPTGGGLPIPTSAVSVAALALVPFGLVPVAIFPPFARTRRRDAIAAIFAEDPNILSLGRFKRSLQKRLRRSQRRPTLFARALSNINEAFARTGYNVMKNLKYIGDEIRCVKTRIMVYGKKVRNLFRDGFNKHRRPYKNNYGYDEQSSYNYDNNYNNNIRRKREIDSLDDCFDDLEEPLYGFRVQVTLAENSPCILGSTCRVNPDFAKRSSDDDIDDEYFSSEDVLDERQTGEEFRSEGSPDCRTTCKK